MLEGGVNASVASGASAPASILDEKPGSVRFLFSLSSFPSDDVTVFLQFSADDPAASLASSLQSIPAFDESGVIKLIFTSSNSDIEQGVVLTAVSDYVDSGLAVKPFTMSIAVSSSDSYWNTGGEQPSVSISVEEDDSAGAEFLSGIALMHALATGALGGPGLSAAYKSQCGCSASTINEFATSAIDPTMASTSVGVVASLGSSPDAAAAGFGSLANDGSLMPA